MMKMHIGKSGRKKLMLPAEFVTETAAILARRGGGKTYTGNVMAEGLLDCGHQVVVIDPLNAWWGLRSSADGKKPGHPIVIFGGNRGDLPLDKGMGEGIADLVAENPDFSCVLSLRHLSKGAQKKFVTAFASRLFHRKGDEKLATAVHIFIDEADIFCPQQVMAREAEMVGSIDDLVRRGRQAGIGVTLITQRSAALNKNVLSQAELLIAGQITGAHDKKAILSWIKDNADMDRQKEFMASLAKLQIGQFWFWSPRWLEMLAQVDIRKRNTFDSSATPKAGRRRSVPKKVRRVDLNRIKKTLESAIKSAESTDPKALRRRVAELEAELRKKAPPAPAPAPVIQGMSKEYVVELVKSELRRRDKQWHAAFKKMFADMRIPTVPEAAIIIERPNKRIYPAKLFEKAATPAKPPTTLSAAGGKAVPLLPTTRVAVENSEAIPKCQKAILQVLASRAGAVSDRLVALQSGYSIKSSGFKNALSWLRTRDLIKGGKASLALTDEGRIVAARFANEPVPVSDPSYWESKLPKCERAIFKTLRTVAHPVDRESLAAGAGYSVTSSGFKNALSKLRGLALIEGSDLIQLTPELFQ